MAIDYIVVPAEEAESAREALGRLFLLPDTAGAGTWPREGSTTQYYVDPLPNTDSTLAALGPRDEFLETVLGKTVECNGGPYTLPSEFQSLETTWFPTPHMPWDPP